MEGLGGRDPRDPEFKNERFTGQEFRQWTDTYKDSERFDIGNFGNLGGWRHGKDGGASFAFTRSREPLSLPEIQTSLQHRRRHSRASQLLAAVISAIKRLITRHLQEENLDKERILTRIEKI